MSTLADGLERAGFLPVNLDYASREMTIQVLALETVPRGLSQCEQLGAQTVHFVTHSMGGILVRYGCNPPSAALERNRTEAV